MADTHENYEVGKFYLVPCIRKPFYAHIPNRSDWMPVLLPAHKDEDLVKGSGLHLHYDFRFTDKPPRLETVDLGRVHLILDRESPNSAIQYRRKKCRREMPQDYPTHLPKWFPELQRQYACAKLVDDICPHRGVNLTGCGDEYVTCPAHGLTWHRPSGELVPVHSTDIEPVKKSKRV